MSGRPRTQIGTYGLVNVRRSGKRVVAETRIRDMDGRLRQVRVTGRSATAARAVLKARLLDRPGYGNGGVLNLSSPFDELAEMWLADLERRDLAEGTKANYRDNLRLHIRPAFENYTLGEITTGRVEWFLKSQATVSYSRARQSRTMLNLLFGFALRNDAITRNPVEGTSPLRKPKGRPKALTLAQVAAIRAAAVAWRSGPGLSGPKPDGQVRDIIEVLLGTGMRIGEVLALRPCDVQDGAKGMIVRVAGTVVQPKRGRAVRQDNPKTEASIRTIAVPEFAASVLRHRLKQVRTDDPNRTIFASRTGRPLSPYNVRRTFREFLELAGLADTGISPRWYRRTAATVIARGMGIEAAAEFLGHTSTAITEGHYIEPGQTVDSMPAKYLERTLRPDNPDGDLLDIPASEAEEEQLDVIDNDPDSGDARAA